MGRPHHNHHRRVAQADIVDSDAPRVVTVNVEVVATVDSNGNVVGQETKTQANPVEPTSVGDTPTAGSIAVPSVPPVPAAPIASAVADTLGSVLSPVAALPAAVGSAIPSVDVPSPPAASLNLPVVPSVPAFPTPSLPVVPSVPSFPSDLRVPSYPWPSGLSAIAAVATTAPLITQSASPTAAAASITPAALSTTTNLASNSTIPNASSLSGTPQNNTSSANSVRVLSVGSRTVSLSVDTLTTSGLETSTSIPLAETSASTRRTTAEAGGIGGSPGTTASPGQPAPPAGGGSSSSNAPLPTPQVVGSVVGSLAGAALILAVILLLLRRHKRKRRGALQLTDDHNDDRQVMAHSSPRSNRIPSAFLHRFSGISRSTAETSTSGGERGFQRVSGRKLPSAFSEGMTSEQFSRGGTMSGSSFYQDDHGTYGGPGLSKEFGKEIAVPMAAGAGAMNIRPSPARTPVIRHPDDHVNPFADPAPFPQPQHHLSPPQSPDPEMRRGTLGRTLHSADGSRSSKFTENV